MYLPKRWDKPGLNGTLRDSLPFDLPLRPALGRALLRQRLPYQPLPVALELQALGFGAGLGPLGVLGLLIIARCHEIPHKPFFRVSSHPSCHPSKSRSRVGKSPSSRKMISPVRSQLLSGWTKVLRKTARRATRRPIRHSTPYSAPSISLEEIVSHEDGGAHSSVIAHALDCSPRGIGRRLMEVDSTLKSLGFKRDNVYDHSKRIAEGGRMYVPKADAGKALEVVKRRAGS